ncbi:ABC transporter ATP-binding protein [Sanguibacter sp. A247]|uniref:ABC transporter ATP-binding protein n=1 Tax=unclassified Sanguibacter TaxID=2645534 RepID=UPI003FD79BE5
MTARTEAFVALDGVGVSVDGTTLLAPVDVSVARGATLVLRGANGSGKSTLLRVVAGLRRPTTGTVAVAGVAPAPRSRAFRSRVAGTVDPAPPARDLTLVEHVALVATTWGTPVRRARADASALLGRLGLEALAGRFPHELSSGQTQLAALAVTLARPAELLLLDEPEQRLDANHVLRVAEILAERCAAGATLVVATHSDVLATALDGEVLTLVAAAPAAPDGAADERA